MSFSYYLKYTIGSFLFLCLLVGIMKYLIWETFPEQFEVEGIILGCLFLFLGCIALGYVNAKHAPEQQFKQSTYVHVVLVFFMFITDLIFGQSEFYIVILRNLLYLALLQIGVWLFIKSAAKRKTAIKL